MKADIGDGRVRCCDCGKDLTQPRMNGTALEKTLWRIEALREGLRDVTTCSDANAPREIAQNALGVDDMNAAES